MSVGASPDEIEAATAYEELFVSALFAEWAPRLVAAARVQPGRRVLDVACGTGVLARTVASEVRDARVCGLDPSPGMLAVARRLAPEVEFVAGAAEALPLPDRSFDAVLSQFGLMFFRDRPAAIREMLRVLVPAGTLAVAVWASLERIPAYDRLTALLERTAGRAAADALREPFSLGDPGALERLFADAGATAVTVQTLPGRACFPSVRTMAEAELRGWLPLVGVELSGEQVDLLLTEAERELAGFVTPRGSVEFPTAAHVVTARAPGGREGGRARRPRLFAGRAYGRSPSR